MFLENGHDCDNMLSMKKVIVEVKLTMKETRRIQSNYHG